MSKDWVKDINEMQYKYGVHKWIHDNKDNTEKLRKYLEFRVKFISFKYCNEEPKFIISYSTFFLNKLN